MRLHPQVAVQGDVALETNQQMLAAGHHIEHSASDEIGRDGRIVGADPYIDGGQLVARERALQRLGRQPDCITLGHPATL